MQRFRVYVWVWIVVSVAGARYCAAGVANGDWKSGDFTDWTTDTSQNAGQESGVGGFEFPLDGPGGPGSCGAQGGVGNCAAFFGAGGQLPGEGASVFLSQDGGPPPGGTGQLFLDAGVPHSFTADLAAVNRSSAPDPDGGAIFVSVHPLGNPAAATMVAQRVFGPLGPNQTVTSVLTGTFVPEFSEFYVLVIEFHRDFPHIPGVTPLNWIDNITLDPDGPMMGGDAVPMASDWSHAGAALLLIFAGALTLRGRRTAS